MTESIQCLLLTQRKLRLRRIKAQEVEQVAQVGMIIEEYLDDPRGPSCLIFGLAGKRPLHVLCGRLDAEEILIITAYEPDQEEWENDGRTRKKK
ncbi:MAG: DUF4258 domain-containing protein [Candidatus Binatia bacterium]